jgi:hypothetical protein
MMSVHVVTTETLIMKSIHAVINLHDNTQVPDLYQKEDLSL